MKKINLLIMALATLFACSACNDEWKDELYTHLVSFKALVNSEGVVDIYLRYKPNGEVIYDLPVLRSGSTLQDEAIDVKIGIDSDTLDILNDEKYQYRSDLYYKHLPEQYYEFLSPTCHMPAGSNKEVFQVKFKFHELNLSDEYVLPLTIQQSDDYTVNRRKGWGKALLHILPFNNYSGNYSATAMNIYFADSGNDPLVVDNRRAHVVDEKTIFFYAGTKKDDAIDRETYKMNVRFELPNVGEDGTTRKGNLTVTAVYADKINFEVIGQPTYEIREEKDHNQPYLVHQYFVLYMSYKYDDVTSVPDNPMSYRAEGSLTMERKINTLIPDEDQAIQW